MVVRERPTGQQPSPGGANDRRPYSRAIGGAAVNPAVERVDELAHENRFISLCRVGFLGRGLLYILIGVLVVGTGRTEDLTGALEYLGRGLGRLLLIGITAGMTAYGLWRLADGLFGMETVGTSGKALRKRVAIGFIGLIYLYLAYKGLRILLAGEADTMGADQQADTVLDLPGGAIILGLAAAVLFGAGLNQLRKAFSCDFLQKLDHRAQSAAVKWLGRVGYAARGVIFLLVAILLGRAALDGRSDEAGGMEQALDLLSGPLLYAVAVGLILFGAFSVIEGLFRRIQAAPVERIEREVRSAVER